MVSLSEVPIEKAMFVSPIVNMEKLILTMMRRVGVGEDELWAKGEIRTAFNEQLSWSYLVFVKENPIV